MKASWESLVNFKDLAATKRADTISANAQWFEDNSPVDPRFKKKEVKGVSAKVITAAMLGGDCYPSTPIGINLPNANWIRKDHGSKSVTIENYHLRLRPVLAQIAFGAEFSCSARSSSSAPRPTARMAGNIHTDMHEVLGHGSGQLMPGVGPESLKNYHSPIEESRADLFALYYIMDDKMVELGLLPNLDAAKAEYDGQVRNGLMTQLTRIQPGKTIEQAHMRGRAMVSHWVYEKGKPENVISRETKDGKTYFVINDYPEAAPALRRAPGRGPADHERGRLRGGQGPRSRPTASRSTGAPQGSPRPLRQAEPGPLRRLRQSGLHAGRREREDRRRQDRPHRGLRRADAEVRPGLLVLEIKEPH